MQNMCKVDLPGMNCSLLTVHVYLMALVVAVPKIWG